MSEIKENIIIAPSILSADFANLQSEIERIKSADWLHIDVMDGHFVPNITIGAPVVKSIRKVTNMLLDVHLMIENPQNYVEDFAKAGADIITFHYEAALDKTMDVINLIKKYGIKVGLSIKPKTNPSEILQYLKFIDLVLVMTVEPGFGGQSFMQDCAEKIKFIRDNCNSDTIIEVDGGINEETAKICKNFGANALVAGAYVYGNKDAAAAINSLR